METNTASRTEELVDNLLESLFDQEKPEIKTLVTHKFPDDDAWFCLWMAKKFIPKTSNATIVFIDSGTTLPGTEKDPSVFHLDTGGGEYDHHQKRIGKNRTCSAALVAKKLDLDEIERIALNPLLEMTRAVDSVEELPETSLHFLIEGYPRLPNNGQIDWKKVQERIFEDFDIIYGQAKYKEESRRKFEEFVERSLLSNGLKIAILQWHPECRDAAFKEGAAVVIWTISQHGKGFYTGIQTNRNYPDLSLRNVAIALRMAEAKARKADPRDITLWFLHNSLALVANGTRSHKLTDEEFTKLVPRQIIGLVSGALSAIPKEKVSQWNAK